jgi:hypothetical protein
LADRATLFHFDEIHTRREVAIRRGEVTSVRIGKIVVRRFFCSLALALVTTLFGVEAFMWSVHDSSGWLRGIEIAGLPVAALAGTVSFFDSNLVYWAAIVAGVLLWWWLFDVLLSATSKNPRPRGCP